MRVPVRISGITKQGKRVSAKGETVMISSNGALLKTESELKPGSEVDVENSTTHQSATYRVVWLSDRPTEGRYEVGLEANPGTSVNIWGIEFPSAR